MLGLRACLAASLCLAGKANSQVRTLLHDTCASLSWRLNDAQLRAPAAQLGAFSAPFGSRLNYCSFAIWLFLAYAGWAIALGSLSALQHYENNSGLSDGTGGGSLAGSA